ncbi:hypothetical protein ACPS0A_05325 [Yersinia pestis]|uniref:hypothetical protein n=1 Tax=Yersinia pestis TaxID=632 RepID=UPI00402B7672
MEGNKGIEGSKGDDVGWQSVCFLYTIREGMEGNKGIEGSKGDDVGCLAVSTSQWIDIMEYANA